MFLALAGLLGGPQPVFRTDPTQLSYWLDEVWALARRMPQIPGPRAISRLSTPRSSPRSSSRPSRPSLSRAVGSSTSAATSNGVASRVRRSSTARPGCGTT